MSEQMRDEIDEALASAFSDVRASDELKAATMARIAEARAKGQLEEQAEKPSQETGQDGNVIETGPRAGMKKRIFAIAASIALCLVIAGGGVGVLNQTETAYAEVITSSSSSTLTIGVNRFGNVINVRAADPSMQGHVDALGLKGKSYDAAMDELAQSGYLGNQSVDVSIGGNDLGQRQRMADSTISCLENSGHHGECNGQGFGKQNGTSIPNAPHDGKGNGYGAGNGHGDGSGEGYARGFGTGSGEHHGSSGHHGEGHE